MTVANGETESWIYCRDRRHLIYTTPELLSANDRVSRQYLLSESSWQYGPPASNGTITIIPLGQTVQETSCPCPFDGQNYANGICGSQLFKSGNGTAANSTVRYQ